MNTQTRSKHDIGKTDIDTLGFLDMWDQRVLSKDEFERNINALLGHEKKMDLTTIACLYGLDKRTIENIKQDPTMRAKIVVMNTLLAGAWLPIKCFQMTVNRRTCSY